MIILIIGPMNSGKTSTMIGKISEYKYWRLQNKGNPRSYVVFKRDMDTRYDDVQGKNIVIAHDKDIGINVSAMTIRDVGDIYRIGREYDIIGIDELHFFPGTDIMPIIRKLHDLGKIIIITFLNGDYRQRTFTTIDPDIYAIASDIIFKKATCYRCIGETSYTTNCQPLDGGPKVVSDDGILFKPACWRHLTRNPRIIIYCYTTLVLNIDEKIHYIDGPITKMLETLPASSPITVISGIVHKVRDIYNMEYVADTFISVRIHDLTVKQLPIKYKFTHEIQSIGDANTVLRKIIANLAI